MSIEFKAWPKIPRVENRKEYYTEKIDGTNACIIITAEGEFACQSRKRIITPEDDNYGFAKWAYDHKDELMQLGEGYHFGEWWGLGVQRGYNMDRKVFSLFNTKRWGPHNPNTPSCVSVVPSIEANSVEEAKQVLIDNGSLASPGFMRVEGVVVYEAMSNTYWKAIIDK